MIKTVPEAIEKIKEYVKNSGKSEPSKELINIINNSIEYSTIKNIAKINKIPWVGKDKEDVVRGIIKNLDKIISIPVKTPEVEVTSKNEETFNIQKVRAIYDNAVSNTENDLSRKINLFIREKIEDDIKNNNIITVVTYEDIFKLCPDNKKGKEIGVKEIERIAKIYSVNSIIPESKDYYYTGVRIPLYDTTFFINLYKKVILKSEENKSSYSYNISRDPFKERITEFLKTTKILQNETKANDNGLSHIYADELCTNLLTGNLSKRVEKAIEWTKSTIMESANNLLSSITIDIKDMKGIKLSSDLDFLISIYVREQVIIYMYKAKLAVNAQSFDKITFSW